MKCFEQKLKTYVFSKEITGKNKNEAIQKFLDISNEYYNDQTGKKYQDIFSIKKTGA